MEEVTARVPIRSLRYIKINALTCLGDGSSCSDVIQMHLSGGWSLKATVDYHFKIFSVFTVNFQHVVLCNTVRSRLLQTKLQTADRPREQGTRN